MSGWTPIRVHLEPGGPVVDWCYTEGQTFFEPFFDEAIARCLHHPFRLLFQQQTPMGTLAQVAGGGSTVPLTGLVLHASRCGSTLIARMLGQLHSTLVHSEPSPLHTVLEARDAYPELGDDQYLHWLRSMLAVLCRRQRTTERQAVVKLDAWSVFRLPWLRRAFPGVPLVFVSRDPVEIVVSQLGHRGYHMIPGTLPPAILGMQPDEPLRLRPAEYLSRVLGAMLTAVWQAHQSGPVLLIDHRELPDGVAHRVAPWLEIPLDGGDRNALADAAQWDAKNPCLPYVDDRPGKQAQAGPDVLAAVERWAREPYLALQRARAAQP